MKSIPVRRRLSLSARGDGDRHLLLVICLKGVAFSLFTPTAFFFLFLSVSRMSYFLSPTFNPPPPPNLFPSSFFFCASLFHNQRLTWNAKQKKNKKKQASSEGEIEMSFYIHQHGGAPANVVKHVAVRVHALWTCVCVCRLLRADER